MEIRNGPAAVTGDESRIPPLFDDEWEGVAGRVILESEDLSVSKRVAASGG